MQNSSRLALYHYWVAFAVFLPAVVLGAWQMLMRSPLPAPLDDPNALATPKGEMGSRFRPDPYTHAGKPGPVEELAGV